MHRLQILPFIILMLAPGAALSQTPAPAEVQANPTENAISVQINQAFVSKTFGNLAVPFMWDVQENEAEQRIVVTETRTHAPAVITIDMIPIPKGIDPATAAGSMIQSVAKQLGVNNPTIQSSKKSSGEGKKKQTLTFFQSEFKGLEKDIERRCALSLLPIQNQTQMLVFSICAASSQSYQPDLLEILNQIFNNLE